MSKIYALNGMQKHSASVKKNAALQGSVVLRGCAWKDTIQLLEGSHRMAFAIELGLPVTIVLFGEDEIIPHDCDNVAVSVATGLPDRCAVRELTPSLVEECGRYHQAVYESVDCPNITIVDGGGNGRAMHFQLTHATNEPFAAFPEKLCEIMFGVIKDCVGKFILVAGEEKAAAAFTALGAKVTRSDAAGLYALAKNKFDLIYAAPDISYTSDSLHKLFGEYRRLLKKGGLAVALDTHPFANILSDGTIVRRYDDLRPQPENGAKHWRMSDFVRWIPAAGLQFYAFLELHADYDSGMPSDLRSAVPRWLASFAIK